MVGDVATPLSPALLCYLKTRQTMTCTLVYMGCPILRGGGRITLLLPRTHTSVCLKVSKTFKNSGFDRNWTYLRKIII